MITAAALLCAALALQDEERLRVDEEDDNFLRHWAAALEENDGRRLLNLFKEACEKKGHKLLRPDRTVPLWIPLPRALAPRLAVLPERIRGPWESEALENLENVRDPVRRRAVAETYSATRAGRDALAALANEDFDRGDIPGAIRAWTRLLEAGPAPELALRLAHAHALRGDAGAVAALAARARAERWQGDVRVGALRKPIADALAAIRCVPPPPPPAPGPLPTAELPLGRLEMAAGEKPYGGRQHAAMIPLWTEVGGRGLLVFSNGIRVLALDPAKADGGPLESAVAWRHPRESGIRGSLPWSHSQGVARPPAGVTHADGRLYVNVFTKEARHPVQLKRGNVDAFEGPSAIRALDAHSGELIWDTDGMETYDSDGEPIKRIQHLFDRRYVCLCGPPLVRGDRLYVPAMSSPLSGRECFVVCFRASDGEPLWKTSVAAFASSQSILSITTLAEEDGTIAVSSNFGVVAALDAETGRVEWLHSYLESADRPGGRPVPSLPVIAGSVIYVLAQDAVAPLAFDRWSGRSIPLPEFKIEWEVVDALAGRHGDWLVFTGRQNWALRMSDARTVDLGAEDAPAPGRAALAGGRLFLPSRNGLRIFDASTWAPVDKHLWAAGVQGGNLAVGPGFVAVLGDKLDFCTGESLLAGEDSDALLKRGRAFEGAGRTKEAVETLERGLRLIEKDPTAAERATAVKARLEKLKAPAAEEK